MIQLPTLSTSMCCIKQPKVGLKQLNQTCRSHPLKKMSQCAIERLGSTVSISRIKQGKEWKSTQSSVSGASGRKGEHWIWFNLGSSNVLGGQIK
jgi:hypothetical protein